MAKRISPIFDTSVFSDHTDVINENIINVLFPTIVLFELVASSIDLSTLKRYEHWRIALNREGRLINPTTIDWWETSKAIRRLYLMKSVPLSKLRTIRNDAVIARLAVTHQAFVVTHNLSDFEIIQRVMPDLKIFSATDYFNT
ncbi:MAG: hypothetical protein ABL952_17490 [Pyrinomonadaceae bacterium]